MRMDIENYTITSNGKKCATLHLDELAPKQQEHVLEEFSHVDDIENSYFALERGKPIPMEEITNFAVNTIPQYIQDYFHAKYPNMYCGVGRDSVYLQGSTIYVVDEYQEWYIKFNIN